MKGRISAVAAFLSMAGCDPEREGGHDASIWGCGDGVVTVDPLLPPQLIEQCDEGDANGSSQSLCTLDCRSGRVAWQPLSEITTLPFPARKLVALPQHLVISSFDDRGIALVPKGNTSPSIILKKYSAPISFEVQGADRVVWIERPVYGLGGPWLLWYQLGTPIDAIHEIQYPLTGGAEGGTFVLGENVGPNGFAEVDLDGRLHYAMVANLNVDTPYVRDDDLGIAPEGRLTLSRIVGPQEVAFFHDRQDSTTVVIAETDPPPATRRSEVTWRKRVVHAVGGYFLDEDLASDQVALLAPDGTVDVWAFHSSLTEITDSLFGEVPAGSQQLMVTQTFDVITVAPSGDIVVLKNNGAGRALAPQVLPIGPPCEVCTIAETAGTPEWFALDAVAIHGVVTPE